MARSLVIFFVAYVSMFSPILRAIVSDFHSSGGPPLVSSTDPLAIASWLIFISCVYTAYQTLGPMFGLDQRQKTYARHKNDLVGLGLIGAASAGQVAARDEFGSVFLPLVTMYSIGYTILFESSKSYKVILVPGLLHNGVGLLLSFFGALICIPIIISLIIAAERSGILLPYLAVLVSVLVIHLALFLFPMFTRLTRVHVHHWYYGLWLAQMCIFSTDAATLAHAFFLAIHLHGVSCFGFDPLFYDLLPNDLLYL